MTQDKNISFALNDVINLMDNLNILKEVGMYDKFIEKALNKGLNLENAINNINNVLLVNEIDFDNKEWNQNNRDYFNKIVEIAKEIAIEQNEPVASLWLLSAFQLIFNDYGSFDKKIEKHKYIQSLSEKELEQEISNLKKIKSFLLDFYPDLETLQNDKNEPMLLAQLELKRNERKTITKQLPKELQTDKAKALFQKAIEAGFVENNGDLYVWKGSRPEAAFFAELASEYLVTHKYKPYKIAFGINYLTQEGYKNREERGKVKRQKQIEDLFK